MEVEAAVYAVFDLGCDSTKNEEEEEREAEVRNSSDEHHVQWSFWKHW